MRITVHNCRTQYSTEQVAVWRSGNALVSINELSPVSTGMGDRLRVRLPHFISVSATQVYSAFYSLWDGKMSTIQSAVTFCGWGVKAGMARLQVKRCVAISERLGKCYSI